MCEEKIKLAIATNKSELLSETPLDFEFSDGTQILHWAAFFGNRLLVKHLVDSNADVEKKGGKYMSTPMFFAAYNRNHSVMRLLAERHADVNCRNTLQWTPLHVCAYNNDALGFILLLCHGADANALDSKKRTPFAIARSRNSKKVVAFERLHDRQRGTERESAMRSMGFSAMLLLHFAVLYSRSIILVLIYMFILSRVLIHYKLMAVLNAMFFATLVFAVDKANGQLLYLVYRYTVLYWHIKSKRLRPRRRGTLKEAKHLVSRLLSENNYNEKAFCYTCMAQKDNATRHCSMCNACVDRASYHCLFFERCVGKKDSMDLLVFAILTAYMFFAIKRETRYNRFLCSIMSIVVVLASMLALSIVCKHLSFCRVAASCTAESGDGQRSYV